MAKVIGHHGTITLQLRIISMQPHTTDRLNSQHKAVSRAVRSLHGKDPHSSHCKSIRWSTFASASGATQVLPERIWSTKRMYALSAAGLIATDFMKTFLDFPQRQQPGSFSTERIMKQLESARAAGQ